MLDLREKQKPNYQQTRFSNLLQFIKIKKPIIKYSLILIGLLMIIFPEQSALILSNWINKFIGTIINNINL